MAALTITNLTVRYGAIDAVKGVSLSVPEGAIVTLLGANGAGKSTTLRAISGIARCGGTVKLGDRDMTNHAPDEIVRAGVSHCPEGRMILPGLTVQENLQLGAYTRTNKREITEDLEFVFTMFPRLKERLTQMGGTLSGGEQQMLAIARALMSRPRTLLLDEPSLGISPILVKMIFQTIVEINRHGVTILLVEQNAHQALKIASYCYVLETGTVILEGPASEIAKDERVRKAYLGEL